MYTQEYYQKNRERLLFQMRKYAKSEKGKANRRRYYRTRQGRAVLERFWNSEKGRVRKEFIAWLKAIPCTDCGQTFPPWCMDFDHVRGEKKVEVSRLKGCSLDNIAEEVQKCEVVCANCHRTRTHNRPRNRMPILD